MQTLLYLHSRRPCRHLTDDELLALFATDDEIYYAMDVGTGDFVMSTFAAALKKAAGEEIAYRQIEA